MEIVEVPLLGGCPRRGHAAGRPERSYLPSYLAPAVTYRSVLRHERDFKLIADVASKYMMAESDSGAKATIAIRPREDRDLDDCVELLCRVYQRDGYPVDGVSDPKSFLQPSTLIQAWVAELHGKIVGHIAYRRTADDNNAVIQWWAKHPDDPIALLGTLFVDPETRGYGIAAKLMEVVEERARSDGKRLVLNNLLKDQAAKRLYERRGWTHYASAKHRYGEGEEMEVFLYVKPDWSEKATTPHDG